MRSSALLVVYPPSPPPPVPQLKAVKTLLYNFLFPKQVIFIHYFCSVYYLMYAHS